MIRYIRWIRNKICQIQLQKIMLDYCIFHKKTDYYLYRVSSS